MTSSALLGMGFGLLLSLGFAYNLYNQTDRERGEEPVDGGSRYSCFISGMFLPAVLLALLVTNLCLLGWKRTWAEIIPFCLQLFLHMSLYFVLLTLALPWLRQHISARACGILWLLPTYLYMAFSVHTVSRPLLLLHLPKNWMEMGSLIWLVGFCGVMLWKTTSHLWVRRAILAPARPVTDPEILAVWEEEKKRGRMEEGKYRLVCSPKVNTPLSVGLMARTTCVVLPQRDYSSQELHLIFRHELIHIGRGDGANKFFMAFCTALCWFNPLMWFAVARSADDLELSCDETVLEGANPAVRKQYANLLLRTAGEERGFTTCLSASASALRYRLTHVMHPKKRFTGCATVGLTFFLLYASFGLVGATYSPGTGADYVFTQGDRADYHLDGKLRQRTPQSKVVCWTCTDPDTLLDGLAGLEMRRITGSYDYLEGEEELSMFLTEPDGCRVEVRLTGKVLTVYRFSEDNEGRLTYLLDHTPDRAWLAPILERSE